MSQVIVDDERPLTELRRIEDQHDDDPRDQVCVVDDRRPNMSGLTSTYSLHDGTISSAQDSDGESATSSAKSAMSSTASSSLSTHEVTFHSQLSDVVNLFSRWLDCEQSIALLILLRKIPFVQWKYLYHQIETRLSTATDLIHQEECANNPGKKPALTIFRN